MPSNPPSPSPRPLEYWLKAANDGFTRCIDSSHQKYGASGIEWLVVHAVAQSGSPTVPELMAALHRLAPLEEVPAVLERLQDEGWLEDARPDPRATVRLRLSAEGLARHATLLAAVEVIRHQATAGIPASEQASLVRGLERLVANLTALGTGT